MDTAVGMCWALRNTAKEGKIPDFLIGVLHAAFYGYQADMLKCRLPVVSYHTVRLTSIDHPQIEGAYYTYLPFML